MVQPPWLKKVFRTEYPVSQLFALRPLALINYLSCSNFGWKSYFMFCETFCGDGTEDVYILRLAASSLVSPHSPDQPDLKISQLDTMITIWYYCTGLAHVGARVTKVVPPRTVPVHSYVIRSAETGESSSWLVWWTTAEEMKTITKNIV